MTDLGWKQALRQRLAHLWLVKFLAISASISAFMVVYVLLQLHPQFPAMVMPRLAVDALVPVVPLGIVPYASLWLYIGMAPGLMYLRGEVLPYTVSALALCVVGCGIFLFFPTEVPPVALDWSPWPVLDWLKTSQANGNACPSLHVGFSVLTVIWIGRLLRHVGAPRALHVANMVWCGLIVWSTLAIRQHVLLDVVCGAVLGGLVTWGLGRVMPPRWQTGRLDPSATGWNHGRSSPSASKYPAGP